MEAKLKHLEFIQAVVTRLAGNSFLLKGWAVTLVSALFALAAANTKPAFVFLAYVPVGVFWGLDGYFLMMERLYRGHYDRVRQVAPELTDFSMSTAGLEPNRFSAWASASLPKTLLPFYGTLAGSILLVAILAH